MKDSLQSFKDISDNWVINIRGSFREEAILFLKQHLGDKLSLCEFLDDGRGWIENALDMMPNVKHDYILLWIEDHINVSPTEIYTEIIQDMKTAHADYLLYSWWMFGKSREAFSVVPMEKLQHIDVIKLDEQLWKKIMGHGHPYYLLSLLGIYRKSFLIRMMKNDRRKLPRQTIRYIFMTMALLDKLGIHFDHTKAFQSLHRLTGYRLRRFSKEAPFDLEKSSDRFDMLPFTMALSRQELFACIDDNLGMPGYSLESRGLYKEKNLEGPRKINERIEKAWGYEEILETNSHYTVKRLFMKKSFQCSFQYHKKMTVTVVGLSGELHVILENGVRVLHQGDVITIPPLMKHRMFAPTENALYLELSTSEIDAVVQFNDDHS